MSKYYYLQGTVNTDLADEIDHIACAEYAATGVEDFSIDEAKVDSILGERSYSGGDVPESVIFEVEDTLNTEGLLKKYYFNSKAEAIEFQNYLMTHNQKLELIESEVEDWNEEWKKTYAPILVSEELEIIPSWYKEEYNSLATKQIYIYPGMGFGTGSHETTFLCLKLYTKYLNNKFKTCLDFGCGSGILGLATRLFNPEMLIDLYDIDPEALTNTEQNIELNNISKDNLALLLPKQRNRIERKYDLVFANILQNVLLHEKDYLVSSLNKGGQLILSGLLKGQEDLIINEYEAANSELKHVETIYKGDWLAILMEQK